MRIHVEFTAKDAAQGADRGDIVIVADVLRCTSSIVQALANGATDITAVRSVAEARALKSKNPNTVLAGERGGLPPKGFDIGNSPRDFSAQTVGGKSVIITTTSGTQAINNASKAKTLLLGSFLNLTSAAKTARQMAAREGRGVTVVMSGKQGTFSLEDFLCAGAIADLCQAEDFSDSAYAALLAWLTARGNLLENILKGDHARELVHLGLAEDVALCCQLDRYGLAPVLRGGRIVRLEAD